MVQQELDLKYCLYARKSSESDERQAMSIDSQINEMLKIAERENLNIVEIRQESKSAKATGQRPEYNRLINDVEDGKFNAILSWSASRISRNAGDLASVVDLMDSGKLVEIRTHSQTFTNNPNEKFLLMILCSQAKLENDNRGKNVKRGLRASCAMGKRPGLPPLGYKLYRDPEDFSGKSKIVLDEERAPFIKKMFDYVTKNGLSGRQVNEYLYNEGFRTRKGKKVTLSMTYRIFKEPFYYGKFEFPRNSGQWYEGKHEPIVTQEKWELANKLLKTYEKSKWGSKVFYFSKLFKCGTCGSGVCGEERINRHGKKYIYYKCTKYGGKSKCNEKYIREEKLIGSIAEMINTRKSTDLKIDKKVTKEVERFNKMQSMAMGDKAQRITEQGYIEYVLKDGSTLEKRQLLECLDGQLLLKSGLCHLDCKI